LGALLCLLTFGCLEYNEYVKKDFFEPGVHIFGCAAVASHTCTISSLFIDQKLLTGDTQPEVSDTTMMI
jgi:hypothetical protein